MDRNIVTHKDVAKRNLEAIVREEETLGKSGKERPIEMGGPSENKADDPVARLAKYIPGEALSLYLALAGVAAGTQVDTKNGPLWFAGIVILVGIFNVLYLRRLWKVSRWSQVGVSTFSLLVYAFGTGGNLVETLPFYSPTAVTIAVIVTTAFLAFFEPPEQPK